MRYIRPELWPVALAAYPAAGVLANIGWAQQMAAKAWGPARAGLGTAAVLNLILPAAAVVLAVAYPRLRTALPGALLLTLGMVAGAMLRAQPRFWLWTPGILPALTHPVQVPATIAYAVLGGAAAMAVRPWRRVGLPDEAQRCGCGYLMTGLESGRCPECGAALAPPAAPPVS